MKIISGFKIVMDYGLWKKKKTTQLWFLNLTRGQEGNRKGKEGRHEREEGKDKREGKEEERERVRKIGEGRHVTPVTLLFMA